MCDFLSWDVSNAPVYIGQGYPASHLLPISAAGFSGSKHGGRPPLFDDLPIAVQPVPLLHAVELVAYKVRAVLEMVRDTIHKRMQIDPHTCMQTCTGRQEGWRVGGWRALPLRPSRRTRRTSPAYHLRLPGHQISSR